MVLSLVLLIIVILSSRQETVRIPLYEKRNLSDCVKYAAAIGVIMHHLTNMHRINLTLLLECACGCMCVAVFFFFSGYGLMFGYQKSPKQYIDSFIKKRLGKLAIPLVTTYAIYIYIYWAVNNQSIQSILKEACTRVVSFEPFLPFSWFITVIVLLYAIFYVAGKFPKKENFIKTYLVLFSICFVMMFIFRTPAWTRISTSCFLVGMIFCKYEKAIYRTLENQNLMFNLVFLAIFVPSYTWIHWTSLFHLPDIVIYNNYHQYISTIAFVLLIANLLSYKKEVTIKTDVLKSSFEVYLLQGSVFLAISQIMEDSLLYYLVCIIACVVFGYILFLLDKRINALIKIPYIDKIFKI